jgi:hypothetical protein
MIADELTQRDFDQEGPVLDVRVTDAAHPAQ